MNRLQQFSSETICSLFCAALEIQTDVKLESVFSIPYMILYAILF